MNKNLIKNDFSPQRIKSSKINLTRQTSNLKDKDKEKKRTKKKEVTEQSHTNLNGMQAPRTDPKRPESLDNSITKDAKQSNLEMDKSPFGSKMRSKSPLESKQRSKSPLLKQTKSSTHTKHQVISSLYPSALSHSQSMKRPKKKSKKSEIKDEQEGAPGLMRAESIEKLTNPDLHAKYSREKLPPNRNAEQRAIPNNVPLKNSLDLSNLNPNQSLNVSNSCNTYIQLPGAQEESQTQEFNVYQRQAKQLNKHRTRFMQLLSEIDAPTEASKHKLSKLAELHELIVNDVARDTRAVKLEAECNELKDKLDLAENNFTTIKQKYSKLKRDTQEHRNEIERVIQKQSNLKLKLKEFKDLQDENDFLKEELKTLKSKKFDVNCNQKKSKSEQLSSLDKIDIKWIKRNNVPDLDLEKLQEFKESEGRPSGKHSADSLSSTALDRKIEEALDQEIKLDPEIVDRFKDLDELKTQIINKYFAAELKSKHSTNTLDHLPTQKSAEGENEDQAGDQPALPSGLADIVLQGGNQEQEACDPFDQEVGAFELDQDQDNEHLDVIVHSDRDDLSSASKSQQRHNHAKSGSFCKSLNEKQTHQDRIEHHHEHSDSHMDHLEQEEARPTRLSSQKKWPKHVDLDEAVVEVEWSEQRLDEEALDTQLEDDFRFESDFKPSRATKKNFSLNFTDIDKQDCFEDEFHKDDEMFSQSWRDQIENGKRQ